MKLYNKWMAEKLPDGRSVYEGAVIRNLHGPYEFGIDKEKRSYQALKWKPRPDAEWPVIRFKDGVGKEKGQVIWICAENEDGVKRRTGEVLPLEERKTFAVTPNMPIDVRKHIFKKISVDDFFEKNIKGQLYTISYSILSKDFLPQQPKGMRFRDQKINQLLLAGYEGSYEIPEVGEHDVGEADDDDLELDE
jgi:ATP-dependent DNA ligase